MAESSEGKRVRMNFGQNAKGLVQMDLTVEMPTTAEAAVEARKAIDEYRDICKEKGLEIVGAATVAAAA